jgi:hypothetical protein
MEIKAEKDAINSIIEDGEVELTVYGIFKNKDDDKENNPLLTYLIPIKDDAKSQFLTQIKEALRKLISNDDEAFVSITMLSEGSSKHVYVANTKDPEPFFPFSTMAHAENAENALLRGKISPNAVIFKIHHGERAIYCLQISKTSYRIKKSVFLPLNVFYEEGFIVQPGFDALMIGDKILIKSITSFLLFSPLDQYVSDVCDRVISSLVQNEVFNQDVVESVITSLKKTKSLRNKLMAASNFNVKNMSKPLMEEKIKGIPQYNSLLDKDGKLFVDDDNVELFVEFLLEKYLVSPTTGDTFGTEVKSKVN